MRLICAHLEDSDCLLVLDMQGDNVTSEQLAQTLNKFQQTYKKITFVIGGADGLHSEILKKAHRLISFGKCTWPHLMIRVMLLEQIYRAQQILANHPYHH